MKWYEENGKYLGFIDGTFLYKVAKDKNGWYWEYVPDMDGFDGYDIAEEAMAEAEADARVHEWEDDENTTYTLEEVEEILGDMIFEARREEQMGW